MTGKVHIVLCEDSHSYTSEARYLLDGALTCRSGATRATRVNGKLNVFILTYLDEMEFQSVELTRVTP